MRLSIGAILMVTVPETIIRSEWRGEAQGTMPKRSTSKRDANVAIISIAQHARPNVTGQIDDLRAQLKILSVDVVTIQPPGMWWIASAIEASALEVLSSDWRDWWYFSHSCRSLNSLQTAAGICGTGGFTSIREHPPGMRRATRARGSRRTLPSPRTRPARRHGLPAPTETGTPRAHRRR